MVRVVRSVADVRAALDAQGSIGLVPTMGALHEGHGSLIDRARGECQCVVVSVFVNPIQFDREADLDRYPRTLDADTAYCEARGADLVFAPSSEEMYPRRQRAFVEVEGLAEHLCGKVRPGHFRGVATVVLKLFGIVRPQRAYFGEKDWQQLAIIRRMTGDLNLDIEIVGCPTVRERDGLALSSRNRLLSERQRALAPLLHQALQQTALRIEQGELSVARAREAGIEMLKAVPEFKVEYFEVVDPDEMQPVKAVAGTVRIAAAAWLGETRLIDNIPAKRSADGSR